MKNIIEKRSIFEKQKEARLLSIEHQTKQLKILKHIKRKISHLKKTELKDYKHILKTQYSLEKDRANRETSNLISNVMEQQKITNFKICFSHRLKNFHDSYFVNSLCFKYYGKSGRKLCANKANFCSMCCNFHIGLSFPIKRVKCISKCKNLIFGKKIERKN